MKDSKVRTFVNIFGVLFLVVIIASLALTLLRKGIWNEEMGLNLLVIGDDSAGVLVLRPKEGLGSWVSLPNELKIKISGSQANYPINSVWKFGLGEKRAYEISERSIGEAMGVILPRMIKVGGEASVETVLGNMLSIPVKTDLSLLDRLAMRKYLSAIVTSKRLLELTIPGQVYEEVEEPDGKIFLEFSQVMTAWSKDKFLFDAVLAESVELIVNNLSGLGGAGLIMSRQAETAGMRVVEVKNDIEDVISGTGCVFESSDSSPRSSELLENHFGCKEIEREGEEGGELKLWLL